MGLFDLFKKKKRTLLDEFNDIVDKGSQKTDTPLMCYKMAYVILPQELHQSPTETLDRIRSQPDTAGALFYTKACTSSGCLPKRQDALAFRTHMGRLSPDQEYLIIEYPSPPPLRLDTGMPILAPYFSAVIVNEINGPPAYFVLGQAPTGGTTLRTVEGGVNANMGSGSEPTLDAFLQLLRSIVKDKAKISRPVEQIDGLNAVKKIIRSEEKILDVQKGEKPKDRFLVEGADKIERKKPEPITYKKGDFIGQKYEVHDVLGIGGLGIVYLVYSRETKEVYALKTFRDEFIEDRQVRERFRKEAQVWIDLDRHPYLVRAYFIDEVSGRFFIAMEYIASDERGLCSLDDYLKRRPPDLVQTLRWAIQFCYGMEYAYSKGIRAHRDIKPANILIGQDKTIKISDFGLAGVVGASKAKAGVKLDIQKNKLGAYQTVEGIALGTPPYMAPEQFLNAAACDERSDIYSFGVVLYQMATGGSLPFFPDLPGNISPEEIYRTWYLLHSQKPVPKLDSPLFPIIQACLSKMQSKRYSCFGELRKELEALLKRTSGESISPPEPKEFEAWEWNNKGLSLGIMGHSEESIRYCDRALKIDPLYIEAWINKGNNLDRLERPGEAIQCYNKAIEIDPSRGIVWNNKADSLMNMGCFKEANHCLDKALEIEPNNIEFLNNKGNLLLKLGQFEQAIVWYDKALEIDPIYANSWNNKAICLAKIGQFEQAILCCNRTLEIDPGCSNAWDTKGFCFYEMGRFEEAVHCLNKEIEIHPEAPQIWSNKGNALLALQRYEEAIRCYDKVLELDPTFIEALNNKGISLGNLKRFEEAQACFTKAIEISPQNTAAWINKGSCLVDRGFYKDAIRYFDRAIEIDSRNIDAFYNKGAFLHKLGRFEEAIRCYDVALAINPRDTKVTNAKCLSQDSLGRIEEAIRCDINKIGDGTQDSLSWHHRGLNFYKNGWLEEAIHCLDKALEINPIDASALYNKSLSLYYLAAFDEAIDYSSKAIELNSQFEKAWITKGLSFQKLGRFEEAIFSFDKALEIDPGNGNTWYSKGQSLDSLNRFDEAIHCFEKALEIYPQYVIAYYAKALVQEKQKQYKNAAGSYKQFISQAPLQGVEEIYGKQIEYSFKRLQEIEGGYQH